jgi:anti-sigma regulatory factor (Ser/Thr protein kinase)
MAALWNVRSTMIESRIFRKNNTLVFQGSFGLQQLHRPLAGLHQAIQEAGYVDVVLDFSSCEAAYPAPMLALCAQVAKLHYEGVDFSLILPTSDRLQRLFRNTNWAHFLDPRQCDPSTFRGYTQLPATLYSSAEDQYKAVNRIVNAILGAIPDIARKDFAALEWAINELTDNVLVHSQSPVGGFVQVSTFQRNKKRIMFIVADAGIGIPNSLRQGHPELTSDVDALDKAIREGVTRDKSLGQGNGLFGTYQICSHSKGSFQVESGYGKLSFYEPVGLKIATEAVPYAGTLVVAEIDFSVPDLLQEALKFNGRVHEPFDYVESHYEDADAHQVTFKIADEANSFGSRVAGRPLRNRLTNLARMCPAEAVIIDFTDVALVSSSFADELIGKLFAEFGPMEFMARFKLVGVSATVQQLIDRAISQRLANGPSK